MKKICDENLLIYKSLGYSYTVFKLKGSKCFSTEDIDKVTIRNFDHQFVCMTKMKPLLLKRSWIKQKPQIILISIWMKMNRLLKTAPFFNEQEYNWEA